MKNFISLGAGVQSSAMALMTAAGEIIPMPDGAIFADTQWEPKAVYKWLAWLETELPFPVYRVTKGSLKDDALKIKISKNGHPWQPVRIPAYTTTTETKTKGLLQRQCTKHYKLLPIIKKMNQLSSGQGCVSWIGISTDEAQRMKDSRHPLITHRWPLIELGMSRNDCLAWMKSHGYPKPPRSACLGCPYHSNEEWRSLTPEEFYETVEWEKLYQQAVQDAQADKVNMAIPFLHPSRVPLGEVQLSDKSQLNLFENECEGMCGV